MTLAKKIDNKSFDIYKYAESNFLRHWHLCHKIPLLVMQNLKFRENGVLDLNDYRTIFSKFNAFRASNRFHTFLKV